MSRDDTNLMEGDILTEENLSEDEQKNKSAQPAASVEKISPKTSPKHLKDYLKFIKKPKFVTIIIAFIILITSFSAIAVLSEKTMQDEIVDPGVLLTSPKPTPEVDKELKKVLDEIDSFSKKVDNLETSIKNYPPPKVDLDVKF